MKVVGPIDCAVEMGLVYQACLWSMVLSTSMEKEPKMVNKDKENGLFMSIDVATDHYSFPPRFERLPRL